MNFADAAVIALVVGLGIRGYFRGFFREAFGLAGWAGGGIAAYVLTPGLTPAAAQQLGLPPAVTHMVVFSAVFFGVYLVCRILGAVLARVARAVFLGPVDRASGLVLGASKGLAVAAVLAMIVTSRRGLPDATEQVQQSPLASRVVAEGWDLLAVLSDSFGTPPVGSFEEQLRGYEHWLRMPPFGAPKPQPTPKAGGRPARG